MQMSQFPRATQHLLFRRLMEPHLSFLLLSLVTGVAPLILQNRVWYGTFARRSSRGTRQEDVPTFSLIMCNLLANEREWVHAMYFENNTCYMWDSTLSLARDSSGIDDPIKCWTDQFPVQQNNEGQSESGTAAPERPALDDDNFYVTSQGEYEALVTDCLYMYAKPFVPKNEDEFRFLVTMVTKSLNRGWFPLTDIAEEGKEVYADGTVYGSGPLDPVVSSYQNMDQGVDCTFTRKGDLDDGLIKINWYYCNSSLELLCLKDDWHP